MNFLIHLRQEWDAIKQSPMACLLCLVIGFGVGSWYYAGRLDTLQNQVSYWKDRAGSGSAAAPVPIILPSGAPAAASQADTSVAHFVLNPQGISLYQSLEDGSSTGIVLEVQIRNSGSSSIATEWRLLVTPQGKSPVTAQLNQIPRKMPVPTTPPLTLRGSDDLSEKVRSNAIQRGKLVNGKLLFYVPLPLSAVQDGATQLKLSVQDIGGQPFETSMRVGDWVR